MANRILTFSFGFRCLGVLLIAGCGPALAQDPGQRGQGEIAPCEALPKDLETTLVEAEEAFKTMDTRLYSAAQEKAAQQLGCLRSPITPRLAADYHRAVAMGAFLELEDELLVQSLQAMLLIQPNFQWDEAIAPGEGHGLSVALVEAESRPQGAPVLVKLPRGAVLRMDGSRSEERFTDRPAVAQVLTTSGDVLWTGYVLPGDPLPPPDMPLPPRTTGEKVGRALLVTASISGGVALGAGIASAIYRERVLDYGVDLKSQNWQQSQETFVVMQRAYQLNQATGRTSQGAALGAAALGVTGLVLTIQW